MKKQSTGKAVRKYIRKNKSKQVWIAIAILTAVLFLIIFVQYNAGKSPFPLEKNIDGLKLWAEVIDPLFGVAVVLITFGIWYNKNQKEWEDDLPKTLTVVFKYKDREVMRCVRAYLAGESDIRQWSQQIGAQMCTSKLEFEPFIKHFPPSPPVKRNDIWYLDYFVVFQLRTLPYPSVSVIKEIQLPEDEKDQEIIEIINQENDVIRKKNKEIEINSKKIYNTIHKKKGCIVWYIDNNGKTKKEYPDKAEFIIESESPKSPIYIDPKLLN
jgi:hypothetical protein